MRVWIEIGAYTKVKIIKSVSPSYEGVDWNNLTVYPIYKLLGVSPSYEGVDWNTVINSIYNYFACFTLLWGCGLKYQPKHS